MRCCKKCARRPPVTLHLVSPSGGVLPHCGVCSRRPGRRRWWTSGFHWAHTVCVCVCVFSAVLSRCRIHLTTATISVLQSVCSIHFVVGLLKFTQTQTTHCVQCACLLSLFLIKKLSCCNFTFRENDCTQHEEPRWLLKTCLRALPCFPSASAYFSLLPIGIQASYIIWE